MLEPSSTRTPTPHAWERTCAASPRNATTLRLPGGLKFEQPAHHLLLEECIAPIEAATTRRDRLEANIEAALPDWSLVPVVRELQALRGMALIAAATLVAGLGDITRFDNPRQLMTYLGLVRFCQTPRRGVPHHLERAGAGRSRLNSPAPPEPGGGPRPH
jgi:transposase